MAAKQRFPWVAVSAAVALVAVAAVAWLQVPGADETPRKRPALPVLALTRGGSGSSAEILAEQLEAYDPKPLFLPSPMNSSGTALPEGVKPGAGGPFAALPPQLTKTGPLQFASPVPVPANPVEGLKLTERADAPLAIRRADTAGQGLPVRIAQVDAIAAGSGQVRLTFVLPLAADVPATDWQPLELAGAVTRAGLAGDLVVTASSGSDEIDEYFRSHLQRNMRIGERLPVGFYVFRVGP